MAKRKRKKIKGENTAYYNISISDLILFAIYSLTIKRKTNSFEELIKECFYLFPQKFCFEKNSKWPDSRKLDRPLRALKDEGKIKSSPGGFFNLTKEGEKIALDVSKILRQKKLL